MYEAPISFEEVAMETLLLYVVVLLSVAICTLGGFWIYRTEKAKKSTVRPARVARSAAARVDPWESALRASRDKI
jgi:hypothetical protein